MIEPPAILAAGHMRIGAGNGTRTRDPELGRLALYQLSYSRQNGGEGRIRTFEGIAGRFTVCSLWPLGYLSDYQQYVCRNPTATPEQQILAARLTSDAWLELAIGLEPTTC